MKQKILLIIALSFLSVLVVKAEDVVIGDNVSTIEDMYIGYSQNATEEMYIGDNVSTNEFINIGGYETSDKELPYGNYYKYSTVQMLYTPSEIGKSGTVKSISFDVANASTFATSEVKVYLGHKSTLFSGVNDYVRSSNLTLVYSGTPTLGSKTGWETLTFNQTGTSFTYNGTDNLVVVVTRKSTSYNSSLKYYYSEKTGCTLYRRSDDTAGYGDMSYTYAYSTSNNRPTIQINIDGPARSNNLPYGNYYKNSTTQMLYTPAEVGKKGSISRIGFKVASSTSHATSEVKIYLGHKSAIFSGTTDFVRSSNLKLVYSGAPTLGRVTGWEFFDFNQGSFEYNGTDNLVVVVTQKCTTYHGNLKYYTFKGKGNTLYRLNDNDTGYADVNNTTKEYSMSSYVPSVCFNINGPAKGNIVPFGNLYKYSTVQTLYTPNEIGKSGTIKSMTFKVANASTLATSEVKVYLGHKSAKFSGKTDFVRSSNLKLVYSGTPTLGGSVGNETLTFNQGTFNYNGTDNLVVVVTRKSSSWNSALEYSWFEGEGCTLYRWSDDYTGYGDVTNTAYEYNPSNRRPAIMLNIDGPARSNNLPYGNYYKNSTAQMLYTPAEIGLKGKISSIAFKVASALSHATTEVKIYLGHKSAKFSGTTDFVRSSNLKLVYSGAPTLGSKTGWEKFTFNQGSFEYNGTDNLVVVVTQMCTTYHGALKYYTFKGNGNTLYRLNDNDTGYADVNNTTKEYSMSSFVPSVTIGIDGYVMPISSDTDLTRDGVTYTLHTNATATVKTLTLGWREVSIPSTLSYEGATFRVTEIGASAFAAYPSYSVTLPASITSVNSNAFKNSLALAVIWNTSNVSLTSTHIDKMKELSPNVLVYVSTTSQLSTTSLQNTTNVVVGTTGRDIVLKDGYNFYCPQQFTATSISYKRSFTKKSGKGGQSAGWESIALPFDVQTTRHETKGELIPFYYYSTYNTLKPFWLYAWGSSGWYRTGDIKANEPYLICMPNNEEYQSAYNITGVVTFSATYATVLKTPASAANHTSSTYAGKKFHPAFVKVDKTNGILILNESSVVSGSTTYPAGSIFGSYGDVAPFRGYIYTTAAGAQTYGVPSQGGNDATGIETILYQDSQKPSGHVQIFNVKGQLMKSVLSDGLDEAVEQLPTGIYIINGKKIIKK